MYITITVINKNNNNKYDLKVDKNQKIIEFLKIINESLNMNLNINNINFIKSITKNKLMSIYSTFEEENIYTGDIIEIG